MAVMTAVSAHHNKASIFAGRSHVLERGSMTTNRYHHEPCQLRFRLHTSSIAECPSLLGKAASQPSIYLRSTEIYAVEISGQSADSASWTNYHTKSRVEDVVPLDCKHVWVLESILRAALVNSAIC